MNMDSFIGLISALNIAGIIASLAAFRKAGQAQASSDAVHAELKPNHGSSTKDVIGRIEKAMIEQAKEIRQIAAMQEKQAIIQEKQALQQEHCATTLKSMAHNQGEHITTANTTMETVTQQMRDVTARLRKLEGQE